MDGNAEVINLSNQLALAVKAALNPEIPQDKRHEAYNACEEFKEKSPFCIQCSVYLALNGSDLVRHFGLQLMEYCVKYKWYDIDQPSKITFKDAAMSLLQSCAGDIPQHVHLRDALSRVIVEMMKREWPQQWPTLLPELFEIALTGHLQAEIVLLTLLRFVEDVVVLQTLEYAQRRKDLYQHFMLQLENVFGFLLNLMDHHYKMSGTMGESVRIINLALRLLAEIVEFAFVGRLVAEEQRLMPVLCSLLADENFHYETAECLNRIATKKGKHEDRRLVCKLLLHSQQLIDCISQLNLLPRNGALVEERWYLFAKKVSELLASLCSLLCVVVKSDADNVLDWISCKNFSLLLEILVTLCNHPSFVVAFNVNTCWNQLFKHPVLKKNSTVLAYVAKWVSSAAPLLVKLPFSANQQVLPMFQECYKYMQYDFDSEDAFFTFYYRFRVEVLDAFRHITAVAPAICFGCTEEWLISCIQKSLATGGSDGSDSSGASTAALDLEWEAVCQLLDTTVANLPKSHDIPLERGICLLDLCLKHKPAFASTMSLLLSSVSALTYFAASAPPEVHSAYARHILELIFACLTFGGPVNQLHCQDEAKFLTPHSKAVRELRKHAGCLLVKQAQKYPFLFSPFYDYIRKVYVDLKNDSTKLNKMEAVLLLEAILLISNSFCDYQRQSDLVEEVFKEVREYWAKLSNDLLVPDCEKFVAYIGLLGPKVSQQTFAQNRSELMYCVEVTAAILKRCSWPDSREMAAKGGFLQTSAAISDSFVEQLPSPNTAAAATAAAYRNPCTPHLLTTLPHVFALIKTMHSLWSPEAKAKLAAGYEMVHEPSAVELKILLGSHIQRQAKEAMLEATAPASDLARLQSFLVLLYEACFTILTRACQNIGASLYAFPNFAPSFVASVFHNLDFIPDYRLRVMVKVFLRPFVCCCPPEKYDSLLVPICSHFSVYMLQRLSNKWKYLKECRDSGKLSEDSGEDCKELIEDFLNTQLSREYMDVVKSMLLKTNMSDLKQSNGFGNAADEAASPTGSQTNLHYASNVYECLSDLGIKLLRFEASRFGLLNFLLNAISWTDSTNSLKASFKIPTVVKQLLADGNMNQEMASQTLISLLQGLQLHGQHDANQGSLLNGSVMVYQLLRPAHPQLLEIMTMVPSINLDDLQKFDQKILNAGAPGKVEKSLKDMFRKLVYNLIGRNIGQLFKRKESIRDLPRIEIPRPKGENILNLSGNENDIGIANFFS